MKADAQSWKDTGNVDLRSKSCSTEARAAMREYLAKNFRPTPAETWQAGWNAALDAAAEKCRSMKDALAILALKDQK